MNVTHTASNMNLIGISLIIFSITVIVISRVS